MSYISIDEEWLNLLPEYNYGEIILLGKLKSLSRGKADGAYASDSYMQKEFKCSRSTLQSWLNHLENNGLITRYFLDNKRRIVVNYDKINVLISG